MHVFLLAWRAELSHTLYCELTASRPLGHSVPCWSLLLGFFFFDSSSCISSRKHRRIFVIKYSACTLTTIAVIVCPAYCKVDRIDVLHGPIAIVSSFDTTLGRYYLSLSTIYLFNLLDLHLTSLLLHPRSPLAWFSQLYIASIRVLYCNCIHHRWLYCNSIH